MNEIQESLMSLTKFIEESDYKGYDPYDGLKSPLFKLPFLKSNKLVRFGVQQLVKRFPINLRPMLFIKPGLNPVTLGLAIQAYSYLYAVESREDFVSRINSLIKELIDIIPEGFSGACWGYDFDWEARYAKIPAYQPNVVATGIITNGLFECYRITGNREALNLCRSAAEFVRKDLNKTFEGDTFCYSYSPFDEQLVFNASMKSARLLAQVYSVTKEEELKNEAQKAIRFVIKNQNKDGSWFYSKSVKGGWVDNYHTGYVLDCLDEFIKNTNSTEYNDSLQKGFKYYRNNFFEENGKPKFYNNNAYPLDCTAGGQSLLTLTRFGDIKTAQNVAAFLIENMQNEKGFFYFRKFKKFKIKTSFMRWSQAWMFCALAYSNYKNIKDE